jgi:outer membrane receptor protein involved in Fe transport
LAASYAAEGLLTAGGLSGGNYINNWLLATNLYLPDLAADDILPSLDDACLTKFNLPIVIRSLTRTLLKFYTKERDTSNALVKYNFTLAEKFKTRVALNVDNLGNDKAIYGFVYAPGTSAKLSVGLNF